MILRVAKWRKFDIEDEGNIDPNKLAEQTPTLHNCEIAIEYVRRSDIHVNDCCR